MKVTTHTLKRIFLILLIVSLMLPACSKKTEDNNKSQSMSGRYVESDIELPKFSEHETIRSFKSDAQGNIHLYTQVLGDEVKVKDYPMTNDGTFLESSTITIPGIQSKDISWMWIRPGYDNVTYICVALKQEQRLVSGLYVSDENHQVSKLEFTNEYMQKEDRNCDITDFYVLENNQIFIRQFNRLFQLNEENPMMKEVLDVSDYSGYPFLDGNNQIAMFSEEKKHFNELSLYCPDLTTLETITLDELPISDIHGYIDSKNSIVFACNEGIYRKENDTTLWNHVLDGSKYSMCSPRYHIMDLVGLDDENFAILYGTDTSYEIMKYVYVIDDLGNQEPIDLTIFTLEKNSMLSEAVRQFRRHHPEVNLVIQEAVYDDTGVTKDDYIRTLNTEILAGKGPDLINFDGLELDSYIEKGALADLSSIITPKIENEELLPKVMKQYQVGQAYYVVPMHIILPMIYSNHEINTENFTWLTHPQNESESDLPYIPWEKLLSMILPIYYQDIVTQTTVNSTQLELFVKEIKNFYDYCQEHPVEFDVGLFQLGLVEYFTKTSSGFTPGIYYDIGMAEELKYSYDVVHNSFIPNLQLGINKNSQHVELAKELITLMLSEEVQKVELGLGFPVNNKAIQSFYDYNFLYEYTGSINTKDGSHKYEVKWLSEENMDQIVEILNRVDRKACIDDSVLTLFHDELEECFQQNCEFEESVTNIKNRLELYLQE